TVAVSEGDQHILHHLTLTVTPANDPPGLAMLGIPETNEDTPLSIVLYVSDLETPAAGLTVTATSHDPVLIPNSNIQVSGSGSIRSLTLTPAPNRNGSALITIRVSDGVDSSTLDLPCTVLPVNDPPVAGFSHALRFPGAGGVTGYSGLTGNDPHTVEAWVRPA